MACRSPMFDGLEIEMINAVTEHRLYELPSCLFLWETLGVPGACFPAPHFFNSVKLQVLYAWESVLAGC